MEFGFLIPIYVFFKKHPLEEGVKIWKKMTFFLCPFGKQSNLTDKANINVVTLQEQD